ncbi:hypothetical protein [Streptomyces sp. NPDC020489]|uniref:hypothetical protein n=1 Tax=Streptomyces sp. NPDC020489 TaxID=3365077 RepID=UPI0037B72484
MAVVEVNNARPRLREAHDRLEQQVAPMKAVAQEGRAFGEAEHAAFWRSFVRVTWQLGKNLLLYVYVLAYAFLAVGLATVEYVSLDWLATPDAGPQEDDARLCLYLVAGSFAWITLPGFGAVYAFLTRQTWLLLDVTWASLRLSYASFKRSRDGEVDTQPQTDA